jgi:uncharacterized protein (DUF1015 family)
MARIKPFYGIRYNKANITKYICPPYDIISKREKEKLKKLSAYNLVRLELPDEERGLNKYANASRFFSAWREKGIFTKEKKPALYFYEQRFNNHGKNMIRRGFFAALRLENPHGGAVKPHERTLSKPKEDRLKLLRSVKANLSPIFGLFNDKGKKTIRFCKKLSKKQHDSSAIDGDGTRHKLWVINDVKTVAAVQKELKNLKIFIADGHHRYETAWNYLQEIRNKDKKYSSGGEYNFVMIYLCPMEDPGLSIWPTHRVVLEPPEFESKLTKYFNVLPAADFNKYSTKSPQPLLVWKKGKTRTLILKNKKALIVRMPGKCKAYRELGVSMLHSLLLEDVAPDKITYVKSQKEALKLARELKCLAVMVPSTPIEAVKEIALANQTMPQKSTYFYPKLASGVVVHSVK